MNKAIGCYISQSRVPTYRIPWTQDFGKALFVAFESAIRESIGGTHRVSLSLSSFIKFTDSHEVLTDVRGEKEGECHRCCLRDVEKVSLEAHITTWLL